MWTTKERADNVRTDEQNRQPFQWIMCDDDDEKQNKKKKKERKTNTHIYTHAHNMWTAPHCINMLLFSDFFFLSRWDCCHKLNFYDMFNIGFGLAYSEFVLCVFFFVLCFYVESRWEKLFKGLKYIENEKWEKVLFIFWLSIVLFHNRHFVPSSKSLLCLADYCLIIASIFVVSFFWSDFSCDNLNTNTSQQLQFSICSVLSLVCFIFFWLFVSVNLSIIYTSTDIQKIQQQYQTQREFNRHTGTLALKCSF